MHGWRSRPVWKAASSQTHSSSLGMPFDGARDESRRRVVPLRRFAVSLAENDGSSFCFSRVPMTTVPYRTG